MRHGNTNPAQAGSAKFEKISEAVNDKSWVHHQDYRMLNGWYVYGDNGPDGLIRTFVWDGSKRCKDTIDLSTRDGIHLDSDIVSFGQDSSGELYVMSHTGVYQLEPK